MQLTDTHRQYWQKNLRITAVLLSIWFVVTFVVAFFARDLNFSVLGTPFSFYMAAQGSLLIFLLIVVVYVWVMERLDREHGFSEDAP